AALPVFFSGEGAEEVAENLPGVSENIIEKHESIAKLAMASVIIAAVAAIGGLFTAGRQLARPVKAATTVLVAITGILMAETAHLGGQIRHTEISSGFLASAEAEAENEAAGNDGEEKEDDDD
ncbi:MAG TPA: hypothetical protein VFZ78_07705, partial [Flavisolibacter sp.]